jgi:hypothetical protein
MAGVACSFYACGPRGHLLIQLKLQLQLQFLFKLKLILLLPHLNTIPPSN